MDAATLKSFGMIWFILAVLFGVLGLMAPRVRGIALAALINMGVLLIDPIDLMSQGILFITLSILFIVVDKSIADKQKAKAEALAKIEEKKRKKAEAEKAAEPEIILKADKPVGYHGQDL